MNSLSLAGTIAPPIKIPLTMSKSESTLASRSSVRAGTALRRNGQATVAAIVEASHEILRSSGSSKFSMRRVAEAAGVTLANLQYYFPHKRDLLHEIFARLAQDYDEAYVRASENVGDDPTARFMAVLDFNMRDVNDPSTRRFFFSIWQMINSVDDAAGTLMKELYEIDVQQLSRFIAELAPSASDEEVRTRATLIASLIEGTLILIDTVNSRQIADLLSRVKQQALVIAVGDH